jgi:hypothetical protein
MFTAAINKCARLRRTIDERSHYGRHPKLGRVSLEELMVSTLAMTDAAVKLLIAKGVFTEEEFTVQLGVEKANYLAVLKRLH